MAGQVAGEVRWIRILLIFVAVTASGVAARSVQVRRTRSIFGS